MSECWFLLAAMGVCVMASAQAFGDAMEPGLHTDIPFGEAKGQSLLLDAYVPHTDTPAPVAIVVHGGGWKHGDKSDDVNLEITDPLTEAGFAWFNINYRLGPDHTWPAPHEDVQAAIQWVKAHAADFRGDATRIALIGYSAGGQIATYTAVTADEATAVQAVVAIAAPNDVVLDSLHRGGISEYLGATVGTQELTPASEALLWEMSAINHLHPGLPPCLFIHGTDDQSVPYIQSLHMIKRLDALGVPSELITIDGGSHRIAEWADQDDTYQSRMTAWITDVLSH